MTRFLRENAELITSICVVISLVLGGALLYLKGRSDGSDVPAEPITAVSATPPAAPSIATQPVAATPAATPDSDTK